MKITADFCRHTREPIKIKIKGKQKKEKGKKQKETNKEKKKEKKKKDSTIFKNTEDNKNIPTTNTKQTPIKTQRRCSLIVEKLTISNINRQSKLGKVQKGNDKQRDVSIISLYLQSQGEN